MSVPSPKGKKCSPIAGFKSGPLKATIPVASLVRADADLPQRQSHSPTIPLRSRFSPDGPSSGQRSPGSLSFKGFRSRGTGSKASSPVASCMRRTASLDAIFLKGHWPTEAFFMHLGSFQVDKATQTDDGWSDKKRQIESASDDLKLEKYLRHRLRTGRMQGLGLRLISPPIIGDHSVTPPYASQEGLRQPLAKPPMRGSLEGLNQEIEKIVLKDFDEKMMTCGSIPEGHRAPLAEILRHTRSVNTQTPGGHEEFDTDFGSSGPPSRGSLSPQYYAELTVHSRNESCSSSPDDGTRPGTSPCINRFLAREPPDGCEKVNMRLEEARRAARENLPPLKPIIMCSIFKPSLGSAFQPLQAAADVPVLNGACELSPSPQSNE